MRVRDYADIYTLTPDWPVDHGVAREAAPEDVRPANPARPAPRQLGRRPRGTGLMCI
jgi:hypothetical protein